MFGISRGRLLLYGAAVALLLSLNAARYLGSEDAVPGGAGGPGARPLELPDLVLARTGTGAGETGAGEPVRDLFRRVEEVPVAAPPPPPPSPPPPRPDPRESRAAEAQRRLDAISVVGIFSAGDRLVAILKGAGDVDNVEAGDPLFPGFVVKNITMTGILVESADLGIRRTLQLGGH